MATISIITCSNINYENLSSNREYYLYLDEFPYIINDVGKKERTFLSDHPGLYSLKLNGIVDNDHLFTQLLKNLINLRT